MDRVDQLLRSQEQLDRLRQDIESLRQDTEVQKELEFRQDLEQVLQKHGKTRSDLARITPVTAKTSPTTPVRQRRRRRLKTYLNPHTGDRVDTRGGNHKVLKAWKATYGPEEVEGWVQ